MGELDDLEKTLAGLSTGQRRINTRKRGSTPKSDSIRPNDGERSTGSIRAGKTGNSGPNVISGTMPDTVGTIGTVDAEIGPNITSVEPNTSIDDSRGNGDRDSTREISGTIGERDERTSSGTSGNENRDEIEIPVTPTPDTLKPLDIEINPEVDKPKRGRGRPPGSGNKSTTIKNTVANNSSIGLDVVTGLVHCIFGLGVLTRGTHFAIDDNQATAIAEPLQKILARQEIKNPKAFAKMEETLEYVELGINVMAVVSPILAKDKEIATINKTRKSGLRIVDGGTSQSDIPAEKPITNGTNGTNKSRHSNWGNLNRLN